MALADDLKAEVAATFQANWSLRKGLVVPEPENIKLGNEAVEFDRSTVLYADLRGSTSMVNNESWRFSAEICKAFLLCAAKIIRAGGGTITSYGGDRIMGVFVGDYQSTSAAKCGLKINYAVQYIVNPALKAQYKNKEFQVKQVVGIDSSPIRAARTGVRGDNDVVWVGRAANYAAKLTELDLTERTWITESAYGYLADEAKFGGQDKTPMWKQYHWSQNGDLAIRGSTWWWPV